MISFQLYGGLLTCGVLMFTVLRNAHYSGGLLLTAIMLFLAANLYRVHADSGANSYCQPFWLTKIFGTVFRNSAMTTKQTSQSLWVLVTTFSYCTIMFTLFVFFSNHLSSLALWAASVILAGVSGWVGGEIFCDKNKK